MTLLHTLGEFVRELLAWIPLSWGRGLFVAVPVLLLIWVLALPREATTSKEYPRRISGNLKLWASVALLIQIAVYVFV